MPGIVVGFCLLLVYLCLRRSYFEKSLRTSLVSSCQFGHKVQVVTSSRNEFRAKLNVNGSIRRMFGHRIFKLITGYGIPRVKVLEPQYTLVWLYCAVICYNH